MQHYYLKIFSWFLFASAACCPAAALSQTNVQGQGKAVIYFESTTGPIVVKLDSVALTKLSKSPIVLKTGTHIVKAWAPTKKLFIDTIVVKEAQVSLCTKTLENTDAYNFYRKNLREYKLKKTLSTSVTLPLTLIYSGLAYTKYNHNKKQMANHLENANNARTSYESSISVANVTAYANKYEFEKAAYESYLHKNNNLAKASCIVIPVGVVATAVLFYFSTKLKKPVYSETPLLSLNNISLQRQFQNDCSIAVSFNINYF